MNTTTRKFLKRYLANLSVAALCLVAGLGASSPARADEADAKKLLKAMSDYMTAQKAVSFHYDTELEIVTKDSQKLALASSGKVAMNRPDKLRLTRTGGFADVAFLFDGKTLTLFGKDTNQYSQLEVPGTIDQLINALRAKGRPAPGADLLLSDVYGKLMANVVDVKDLGSGVIGGIECDHLAFRTNEVDWEIWIAQGSRPYPCRYIVTSAKAAQAPQYRVSIKDWKTGTKAGPGDFSFKNATKAKKVELPDLPDLDELPSIFAVGGEK